MSPTVFRFGPYRFFFFSREEQRPHVHVYHGDGEAKIWLEPAVGMAQYQGLSPKRIKTVLRLVREHEDEIRQAWKKHFGN